MNKQKSRQSTRNKKLGRNKRQQAGLPAKAGRRRSPHIASHRDSEGKRQWATISVPVNPNQYKKKA